MSVNPTVLEVEKGGLWFEAILDKNISKTSSQITSQV
jgi:hypothetical protein